MNSGIRGISVSLECGKLPELNWPELNWPELNWPELNRPELNISEICHS